MTGLPACVAEQKGSGQAKLGGWMPGDGEEKVARRERAHQDTSDTTKRITSCFFHWHTSLISVSVCLTCIYFLIHLFARSFTHSFFPMTTILMTTRF